MNENKPVIKNKKSALRMVIVIIVVIIAMFCLWRFGNSFSPQTSPQTLTALTINITNCDSVLPQNAVVVDGGGIVFKNSDNAAHQIDIGGKSVNVPAKGRAGLKAEFQYGTGTYGYACDSKLTSNQIALVPIPGSAAITQVAFKTAYDGGSAVLQSCLETALGAEFNKAYGDAGYVPSNSSIDKVNDCFVSARGSSQIAPK